MGGIKYSEVIERLYDAFPRQKKYFDVRVKQLYADNNPHVIYGSVFVEFVMSQISELASDEYGNARKNLELAFGLLEQLVSSDDDQTRWLVEASVLESLIPDAGGVAQIAHFMGPKTRRLALEVQEKMRG